MTATIKVNRKMVTYTLSQMTIGENVKADLIARGFDGTYWMGEAGNRNALFIRDAATGKFELAI